jgi:hypothetical protein
MGDAFLHLGIVAAGGATGGGQIDDLVRTGLRCCQRQAFRVGALAAAGAAEDEAAMPG